MTEKTRIRTWAPESGQVLYLLSYLVRLWSNPSDHHIAFDENLMRSKVTRSWQSQDTGVTDRQLVG